MSRQDLASVRLTLIALFLTFLITAAFLVSIVSPPPNSPTAKPHPEQQHHDDDPHVQEGGMVDALAEAAKRSFSDSWAYYAPYYPAAPFQESMRTRKGCIISQVNIVSRHNVPPQSMPTQF